MTRLLAVVAIAVAGTLTGVIVASSGGSSGGSSSTSTAATTPPVVAPAIPCSSSSGQTPTTTTATTTAATTTTTSPTTWTGVFERVTANLENDGSVKKTPRQFTRVSAEGNGPVTIEVPMQDKQLRRRDRGKKPSFSNGMAQVNLDPSGTKTQEFDSDFGGSLPLAVKVSYKLNGKPVSAGDVKHKSGTVEVEYQLNNTTTKPVTVCFKGFNGSTTKQTVSTPIPIIAYLSFTVPSNASTFHAPGASLAPARKGVGASWVAALFPPLGKTAQTFTFTMDTSKADIPEADLLLETLNPLSPSGVVPQKSAVAVGKAAAAADNATAKVQSDIAALQLRASQPKQPRSSSRKGASSKSGRSNSKSKSRGSNSTSKSGKSSSKPRSGKSSPKPKSGKSSSKPALSFGTPPSALTTMQSQIAELGRANLTFIANVNRPTRTLFGTTRTSIDGMAGTSRRAIDGSTTEVDRTVRRLNKGIDRSLGGFTASMGKAIAVLKRDLRRATATPSLMTITASAARLQLTTSQVKGHADAVAAEVAPLAAQINELVAGLQAPVQNSADLVQRLAAVKGDLDGLNGADKTDPTFLKLVADVAAMQQVASTVSSELTGLQQKAQAVATEVNTLQTDVLSLQNEVTALAAAAIANAEGTIQGRLAMAVAGLDARFAKAQATAARAVAAEKMKALGAVNSHAKKAKQSVAAAGTGAKGTVSSADSKAQRDLTSAVRRAQRSVLSAERSVTETLTSVQVEANRALAAAKQKAKQGGQATLAAAQAAAAQAAAAVGDAVDTANADYARLLTTNEVAVANQLPGGDATGVTVQNGSFVYLIKGT